MLTAAKKLTDFWSTNRTARLIGPIGVDFALECLHLVQLECVADGAPTVRARASLPYDCSRKEILSEPRKLRDLVGGALAGNNFQGRNAVVAVPSGLFRTVSINYQISSEIDDDAAILNKMRDRLDKDLSDYAMDYMPVKSRSLTNEKLALVAICEKQPIVEFLDLAKKARLSVESLEIGPVAIGRLVGAISNNSNTANVLVINSGRHASYLTLISGNDVLFDQQVNFGESELIQQVAETLDMSIPMARDLVLNCDDRPEKNAVSQLVDDNGLNSTMSEILKPQFLTLADEIKRVCMYAAAETRGGAVSRIYLLGSIARWPGAAKLLGSLIDISVSKIPNPLQPFDEAGGTQSQKTSAPEIAVSTGLALKGL